MSDGTRYVSRLTRETQALVLAGGRGSRLKMLTDWRAKPAVPFGGQFRIIDFALSNCLHSNIRRISVMTQYKSHSLIRHLMRGWNRLNNDYGGILDVIPAQQWLDEESWYSGTANAVYQGLDILEAYHHKYTLILAGDHIYKMDYGEMLGAHARKRALITVACNVVPIEEAHHFGVIEVDDDDRIIGFEEKPERPKSLPHDPERALVSMGLYVFCSRFLHDSLERDAKDPNSSHDFGKDIIPNAVASRVPVFAFPLHQATPGKPYWRDVGTIDAFFQAHMELLEDEPVMDMNDPSWPIYTKLVQSPPARFTDHGPEGGCKIIDSIVSNGCVVSDSRLEQTLLSSDCRVAHSCRLDRVVALPGCEIRAGCRLNNVLLDNGCILPEGTVIGMDPDEDARRFHLTDGGVVVVNREMLGQERRYQPADLNHMPNLARRRSSGEEDENDD
ncbi:glucose-1-phosphate adenylyltransferase [Wenzhouxiangella marina]|uniref:Glucose-1-phosphate adenylyltransferase n=1 Tax=Wenzhouxiangella marina TaxID=1579979 RepID=A0A0K0XTY8_9GAMM|nr:Glucose-1-phosphate adenylyltransferase [Wenzhouxiangella marina]MBB6088004.1 glucose-1-phosphate adenylyltransferase [Wenzhouxiangella marina]